MCHVSFDWHVQDPEFSPSVNKKWGGGVQNKIQIRLKDFQKRKRKTMFTAFSVRDSDLTGLGCGPSIIMVSCAARFQKHPVFPALGGPCESLPSRLLNASPWLQPTHQAARTAAGVNMLAERVHISSRRLFGGVLDRVLLCLQVHTMHACSHLFLPQRAQCLFLPCKDNGFFFFFFLPFSVQIAKFLPQEK